MFNGVSQMSTQLWIVLEAVASRATDQAGGRMDGVLGVTIRKWKT